MRYLTSPPRQPRAGLQARTTPFRRAGDRGSAQRLPSAQVGDPRLLRGSSPHDAQGSGRGGASEICGAGPAEAARVARDAEPGERQARGPPCAPGRDNPRGRRAAEQRPDSSEESRGADGDPRGGKAAQGPWGADGPAAPNGSPRRQQRDRRTRGRRGKSDGAPRARHSLAGMRAPQEHADPGRGAPLDDGLWPTPGGSALLIGSAAESTAEAAETGPTGMKPYRAAHTLRSPRLSGTKELGNDSPDSQRRTARATTIPRRLRGSTPRAFPHPGARAVPAGICSPRRRKADPEAGSAPAASPTSFHVLSPVAAATRGRAGRGVVIAAGARVHVFLHRARFVPLAPKG